MNPSIPLVPAEDPAVQQEAERLVCTAKDLLSRGGNTEANIERCRYLLIKAVDLDPCTPGGRALLVAAVALRTTHHRFRLPSGNPDPYRVFGLDPAVPTARDPAVIESYYRQASDLLRRAHPLHPCYPAFAQAARLVDDAWAVLSDAQREASLDDSKRSPAAATTTPSDVAHGRRAGSRSRKRSVPSPPAATTTPIDVAHGRRAGLRSRKRSVPLAGDK